jgi:hypothetical protein
VVHPQPLPTDVSCAYNAPNDVDIFEYREAGNVTSGRRRDERGEASVRTRFGLLMIVVMSLVLAACGGGDDEEPTPAATEPPTTAPTATEASTEAPTEAASLATAIASPAGVGLATPAASPVGMASPVAFASPVASPIATPLGSSLVPPVGGATPDASPDASPEASPVAGMIRLAGVVTLPGTVNEAYLLSEAGCVGLGEDADLRSGRQVVVRDETGTIIGVTTLEASDLKDACVWSFAVDVPEAEFYAISIPMKTEMVFTRDEVERSHGELAIPVR